MENAEASRGHESSQTSAELPTESFNSAAGEGVESSGAAKDGSSGATGSSSNALADGEVIRAEEVVADVEATERYAAGGAVFSLSASQDTGHERGPGSSNRDLLSAIKLGDAVEEDARAVARSLTSLLASLKSALSEVTGSSLEHMRTENEAAGQVQDAAIDAATKGNRFINACLRLNKEMKGMKQVASQLESLKHRVDHFEHQSNRYLLR